VLVLGPTPVPAKTALAWALSVLYAAPDRGLTVGTRPDLAVATRVTRVIIAGRRGATTVHSSGLTRRLMRLRAQVLWYIKRGRQKAGTAWLRHDKDAEGSRPRFVTVVGPTGRQRGDAVGDGVVGGRRGYASGRRRGGDAVGDVQGNQRTTTPLVDAMQDRIDERQPKIRTRGTAPPRSPTGRRPERIPAARVTTSDRSGRNETSTRDGRDPGRWGSPGLWTVKARLIRRKKWVGEG